MCPLTAIVTASTSPLCSSVVGRHRPSFRRNHGLYRNVVRIGLVGGTAIRRCMFVAVRAI